MVLTPSGFQVCRGIVETASIELIAAKSAVTTKAVKTKLEDSCTLAYPNKQPSFIRSKTNFILRGGV